MCLNSGCHIAHDKPRDDAYSGQESSDTIGGPLVPLEAWRAVLIEYLWVELLLSLFLLCLYSSLANQAAMRSDRGVLVVPTARIHDIR